jgi:HD-GYP domain-containing protein (c-di-GMP phosphodiesterase class II)
MNEERVQRIRLAGVLHDIGKIGVPDSILCKPGPLTSEEMDQMRRHPELGARILSSRELDDVREWILAHHERPDGTGYPRGLTADEIPIEAAILAVGDAYEAMTSDRVYRMSIGHDKARDELERWAGKQFSREVVDAFLRALDRERVSVS